MTRYNSFEKFTISSKPVTADYIHAGVFVPVFDTAEGTERFTFSPLGNAGVKLAYWDQEAWASELVVFSGTPKLGPAANEGQTRSAADQAAAAAENEGLLEPGKETEVKTKKRKADASAAAKQKKVFFLRHIPYHSTNACRLHRLIFNSGATDMQNFTVLSLTRLASLVMDLKKLQKKGVRAEEKRRRRRLMLIQRRNVVICVLVNSRQRPKSTSMSV